MPVDDRPSGRSALGFLAIAAGLLVYAFVVAAIGDYVAPLGTFAETVYYAVFGVLWVIPAVKLVRWTLAGHK